MAENQEKPVETEAPKEQLPEKPSKKPAPEARKTAPEKDQKDQKKPPSKFGLFIRRLLRGIFIALLLFAAGMVVSYVFVQQPRVSSLNTQVDQLQAENVQLQDQVLQLQADVDDLTPLEDENRTLVSQLTDARLHVQILSALKDVQAARIAVAEADFSAASVALTRTEDKLEELRDLLSLENQGVVDGMLQRLELAVSGLDGDAVAAAADLSVLANSLIQLENTLFTEP